METLGARKPSDLLADMWEICPPMQHNSIFFAALFLQRLPRDIRLLLTHEDHSDLRRLASHADQLIPFGCKQDTVAAVINTPQEETVAAIQHKGKQSRGKNKKQPPPLPP